MNVTVTKRLHPGSFVFKVTFFVFSVVIFAKSLYSMSDYFCFYCHSIIYLNNNYYLAWPHSIFNYLYVLSRIFHSTFYQLTLGKESVVFLEVFSQVSVSCRFFNNVFYFVSFVATVLRLVHHIILDSTCVCYLYKLYSNFMYCRCSFNCTFIYDNVSFKT